MKKRLLVFFVLFLSFAFVTFAQHVKLPNVSGSFYPNDSKELIRLIDGYVANASTETAVTHVDVAFVPHAGYVYSGAVAGYVYKSLTKTPYKTVVVLAPSHFYAFQGAAIWSQGSFQTPLGSIPVDQVFSKELLNKTPFIVDKPEYFEKEHALEVQLPFIQRTFPQARLVPMVLGTPDFKVSENIALSLHEIIGNRNDVLVIVSTDFSHYLPYDVNNAKDAKTLQAIQELNLQGFWDGNVSGQMEMCGFVPATIGIMLAKLRGLTDVRVLKHANSGDSAGDRERVVGYASIVFSKPQHMPQELKDVLLTLSRQTLINYVRNGHTEPLNISDPRLNQIQGAFVTLKKNGQLRGCIGNIISDTTLAQSVVNMTIAAATQDHRFDPVTSEELEDIHLEISALSVPQQVDSLASIVLGRDGVIISAADGRSGVFLPQVAIETGWSKEKFLEELCSQKAGLSRHCYKDNNVKKYIFTAEVFDEK